MKVRIETIDMSAEQNKLITAAILKEKGRLHNFIRKRVRNEEDAEDILQEVFSQLVETYRLMKPVEQVSAWLFTVARNKITDMFRKKKAVTFTAHERYDEEGEPLFLEELLSSSESGPEDELARNVVMKELEAAMDLLPEEQKEVFVMHEIEDLSFKEIARITGKPVNTLISRKRYAVLFLRQHLLEVYKDFTNG